MMDAATKRRVLARLRRVEGQVAGIARMVEDDRYCVDVLLQIAAARAALARVGRIVLESHARTCVAEAFERGSARERDRKIAELLDVFERYGSG